MIYLLLIQYSQYARQFYSFTNRKGTYLNYSTKGGEGSGFGLAICKRIVEENHNGYIKIHSNFGKEITFSVFLPNV